MENLLPQNVESIINNATEVSNGELPVAVDHRQLRTMALETVDSINWP